MSQEIIFSINLNTNSGEPIVEQLRRQLMWQIASGQFKPGDRLPSVRCLANQLSINLHTVRKAYQRLEKDGIVQTRQGFGTQVLDLDPKRLVDLAGRTKSHTIGVILPGLSNPVYHALLEGVEQAVRQRDLMIFTCDAHDDPEMYFRYFSQLAARNVDGIIIGSFDLQGFLGGGLFPSLPIVTVDAPHSNGPSVNFDLKDAARQAVGHLVEHGHRRIGMITFHGGVPNVHEIHAGYSESLEAAGIQPDEKLIAYMPSFLAQSGEVGVSQLMALDEPPTAIFTIADTLAMGALGALKKGGWQVPNQIAISSLNNIPSAKLVEPPITSVDLPAKTLGFEAAKILLDLMDGKPLEKEQVKLSAKIIIRRSCGCPD